MPSQADGDRAVPSRPSRAVPTKPCQANRATSRTDPPQFFCHVCRCCTHLRHRDAWTPVLAVAVNLLLRLHGRRLPPEEIVVVVVVERDLVRVIPSIAITNRPNNAIAIIVVLVLPLLFLLLSVLSL